MKAGLISTGSGLVRMTETETASWGSFTPILRLKSSDQIPAAQTTCSHATAPHSVPLPETRPASVSIARTAQPSKMRAPSCAAALASAGTALAGSARPSLAVYSAPFQRRSDWPSNLSVSAAPRSFVSSW